jgi:hypothetical protein
MENLKCERHASDDEENVNASSLRGNRLSANCFKNQVIWKTSGEAHFSHLHTLRSCYLAYYKRLDDAACGVFLITSY